MLDVKPTPYPCHLPLEALGELYGFEGHLLLPVLDHVQFPRVSHHLPSTQAGRRTHLWEAERTMLCQLSNRYISREAVNSGARSTTYLYEFAAPEHPSARR